MDDALLELLSQDMYDPGDHDVPNVDKLFSPVPLPSNFDKSAAATGEIEETFSNSVYLQLLLCTSVLWER